jgi:hypothetical protein
MGRGSRCRLWEAGGGRQVAGAAGAGGAVGLAAGTLVVWELCKQCINWHRHSAGCCWRDRHFVGLSDE